MSIKQQTVWPTEADFEADLQVALSRAFPWLPSTSIRHQTKFSFNFGRSQIHVDGRIDSTAYARADILLYSGQRPLAVLELKRPGHSIDEVDIAQGLSYARMLHPRPPLVAVTNGTKLALRETHTGNEWTPSERSETEFAKLLKAAFAVADGDLKNAVSTLMGSGSSVWTQAVRQTSNLIIDELSGGWDNQSLPFVAGFQIPRKATAAIVLMLRQGERLVLIEGPPLSGKSNVLRELTSQTADSEDLVVLFIEGESGSGIFQTIAGTLSDALSWPVTRDEARDWLRRLSRGAGPSLVIAVDGLAIGRDDIRVDVEDLTSNMFGSNVRVVVALDDSLAEQMVLNSTGRKSSAIGRRATRVALGLLDDEEFGVATEVLFDHRVGIMKGGHSSPELRIPWILRAAMSHIAIQERYKNHSLIAALPPLLGLEIIEHARERFPDDELRRLVRGAAEAVLKDAEDRTRPIGLILISMATFVVRRKALRSFLEHAEIEKLVQQGVLRPMMHDSGEATMVIRAPELLASEAASVLGSRLALEARVNAKDAALSLAKTAANIPLGDIVAAQALLDAADREGTLPLNLITALINSKPERHLIAPGTRAAMYVPGAGTMEMSFEQGGSIVVHAGGKRHRIKPNPGDEQPVAYDNIHAWLLLSHLASRPFAIEEEGEPGARVDPMILIEVGTCPIVLRAVGADPDMSAVATHHTPEGEVVCEKAGLVEPITVAIFKFLGAADSLAEDWLDAAVTRNSLPLLMRLHTALDQLVDSANPRTASFARQALSDSVIPALSNFPSLH